VLAVAGIVVLLVEPFQSADGKTAVRPIRAVSSTFQSLTMRSRGRRKADGRGLDPEDKVLGHAETQVAHPRGTGAGKRTSAGQGVWRWMTWLAPRAVQLCIQRP